MTRPSQFHTPGLPAKTNGTITKILRAWRKDPSMRRLQG